MSWNIPSSQKGRVTIVQKENHRNLKVKLHVLIRTEFFKFSLALRLNSQLFQPCRRRKKGKKRLLLLRYTIFMYFTSKHRFVYYRMILLLRQLRLDILYWRWNYMTPLNTTLYFGLTFELEYFFFFLFVFFNPKFNII